jgi:hypothetical protein
VGDAPLVRLNFRWMKKNISLRETTESTSTILAESSALTPYPSVIVVGAIMQSVATDVFCLSTLPSPTR